MEFTGKKSSLISVAIVAVVLLSAAMPTAGSIDCSTVSNLISGCSNFINYGSPEPDLSSQCCGGLISLNNIANDSTDNRRSMCNCILGLITTYNPNATTVNRLSPLCGISLGFSFDPNTDCDRIP